MCAGETSSPVMRPSTPAAKGSSESAPPMPTAPPRSFSSDAVDMDVAAVAFDAAGALVDAAYYNQHTALDGALALAQLRPLARRGEPVGVGAPRGAAAAAPPPPPPRPAPHRPPPPHPPHPLFFFHADVALVYSSTSRGLGDVYKIQLE